MGCIIAPYRSMEGIINFKRVIGALILIAGIGFFGGYQYYEEHHREPVMYTVSFPSYGSVVTNEMSPQLADIAIKANDLSKYKVVIVGHSSAGGDTDANMELSQARSDAVRDFLVSRGVNANRIESHGVGGTDVLPRQINESDRSYNMRLARVDVILK